MTTDTRRPHGFRLRVEPAGPDSFGLLLEETERGNERARAVAHLVPDRASRILDLVLGAVKASGHARSDLSARRKQPLGLSETPGVRVALAMFATGPMRKHRRIDAAVSAIDRLSDEEAYYWYGKCVGDTSSRSRRALRLLLADE